MLSLESCHRCAPDGPKRRRKCAFLQRSRDNEGQTSRTTLVPEHARDHGCGNDTPDSCSQAGALDTWIPAQTLSHDLLKQARLRESGNLDKRHRIWPYHSLADDRSIRKSQYRSFKTGILYKVRVNGCEVRHFPTPCPPIVGGGLGISAGQDHRGRKGSLSSSTCTSCVTCTLIEERSGLPVRFFGERTCHPVRPP